MSGTTDRFGTARRFVARPGTAIALAVLLLLASLALAFNNDRMVRRDHTEQLTVQADILAGSVSAALAFDDRATTQEYLDALRVNPELDAAGVYDLQGRLVDGFAAPGELVPQTSRPSPDRIANGELVVTAPVVQDGTPLGSVYLRAPIEPLTRRISRYLGIGIVIIMAALLIAGLGASYAAAAEANRRLKREMEARQAAEAALRQSQKMEAMGQLTGGVAHDFNNLLMAASSGLELLDRTDDPARRQRLRQGIRQAIDRGAKLTQQLLTFARRSPVNPEVIDLGRRIADLSDLLDRALREDIKVAIAMPPELWPVEVDVAQFEVAVLNLAVNARDAMPSGGPLRITARNVPGEDGGDDQVRLSVTDAGTGMPPELIDKVFEPFFTTKGVGHGTGLGLSQVYGFARSVGGSVAIDSVEGEGTTVTITFPRSAKTIAAADLPTEAPCGPDTGKCRVLLAEDDPQVGEFVEQMLVELGYETIRADNAAGALALLDRGVAVDALLSDMVMPGEMGGLELAQTARRKRPALPVVLMTGYSAAAAEAVQEEIELLTKPFSLDQLRAGLGRAIGERATD